MSDVPAEVLHADALLLQCLEPGCTRLADGFHCARHRTPEDAERLHALDMIYLRAATLEEGWRAARRAHGVDSPQAVDAREQWFAVQRVARVAEADAGVHRVPAERSERVRREYRERQAAGARAA